MAFPICNDIDPRFPVTEYELRHWDDEGFERTERRIGASQCPKCGLWWPAIEEPDCWEENEATGRWDAVDWMGFEVCEQCGLLMVVQPDGSGEVYEL